MWQEQAGDDTLRNPGGRVQWERALQAHSILNERSSSERRHRYTMVEEAGTQGWYTEPSPERRVPNFLLVMGGLASLCLLLWLGLTAGFS